MNDDWWARYQLWEDDAREEFVARRGRALFQFDDLDHPNYTVICENGDVFVHNDGPYPYIYPKEVTAWVDSPHYID